MEVATKVMHIVHAPLPLSQQDAIQSVMVRKEEQQGGPQGADQGRGSASSKKVSILIKENIKAKVLYNT